MSERSGVLGPGLRLMGNYFSPYTRRVAVSLKAIGEDYELDLVSVINEQQKVQALNPIIRVPVLILPDGEALIESYAILDELDQRVGPTRALTPLSGPSRRRVMQTTALALACMEKAQWAYYEGRFRPEQKVHEPWVAHNDNQVVSGLRRLDQLAAHTSGEWLAGTPDISQADITTTVIFTCIKAVRPHLDLPAQYPHLQRFTTRCEDLAIFRGAPLPTLPAAPAKN